MIVARDRGHFLQQLLVSEVIARRGEGPLARKRWPPPPPSRRGASESQSAAAVTETDDTQGGGSR